MVAASLAASAILPILASSVLLRHGHPSSGSAGTLASNDTLRSSLSMVKNMTSGQPPRTLVSTGKSHMSKVPCHCIPSNPAWKPCARTMPRCVFIDLGAADGNSFNYFMNNGYGEVGHCPNVQWSAILVEANPRFSEPLKAIGKQYTQVAVRSSTAAYMCESATSFYLDSVNTEKNFWGSSMSSNHPDVQASGKKKVTVPTVNLNRILLENTIPGDWVMVKMDIEGAEYDVLPCLADSPAGALVDRLYLEQHDPSWGMTGTSPTQMEAAKAKLRGRGVDIPDYFSYTL